MVVVPADYSVFLYKRENVNHITIITISLVFASFVRFLDDEQCTYSFFCMLRTKRWK